MTTETQIDPLDLRAQAENPAELLPILQASIVTFASGMTFVKHPFVNEIYFGPAMHAQYNRIFEYKRKAVATAEAEEEWASYVFIHERPWRFEALLNIADRTDDATFWALVRDVWMDSENIPEHEWEWDELLRTDRPGRENMMEDDERAALAELPDTITVFQGHTDARDDGWSWTTKRETAEWFAKRFAGLEDGEPHVTTATVAKADVTAYLLGRNEYEILVAPEAVTLVSVTVLSEEEE